MSENKTGVDILVAVLEKQVSFFASVTMFSLPSYSVPDDDFLPSPNTHIHSSREAEVSGSVFSLSFQSTDFSPLNNLVLGRYAHYCVLKNLLLFAKLE